MNLADIIILVLVLGLVWIIAFRGVRKHKASKESKCARCAGCHSSNFCQKNKK